MGKKIADKIAYVLEEISVELTEEERIQFYHSRTLISKGLDNIAINRNGDNLGSVIGTHAGPGAIVEAFFKK